VCTVHTWASARGRADPAQLRSGDAAKSEVRRQQRKTRASMVMASGVAAIRAVLPGPDVTLFRPRFL
jgi:hypothetical protein